MSHSKRANGRVSLPIPAYLHPNYEDTVVPARTTNIGVGGFHPVTNLPVAVGNQMEVTLMLTPPMSSIAALRSSASTKTRTQAAAGWRPSVLVDLNIAGEARIAEALAALSEDTDPTAVPMAWHSTDPHGGMAG